MSGTRSSWARAFRASALFVAFVAGAGAAACSADGGDGDSSGTGGIVVATGGGSGTGGDAPTGGSVGTGGGLVFTGGSENTGGSGSGGGGSTWVPPVVQWDVVDDGTTRGAKDPSIEGDVASFFGAPVGTAKVLRYPLSGSVHPINIGKLSYILERDAGHELVKVEVKPLEAGAETGSTYQFYVKCVAGTAATECEAPVLRDHWVAMAAAERGRTARVTVFTSNGTAASTTATNTIEITLSPEPMVGALYYWAAAQETLKRADISSDQAVEFVTGNADYKCVACHAVSRDGTVVAFAGTADESDEAGDTARVYAVNPLDTGLPATPAYVVTPPSDTVYEHNVALNHDGSLALVNGVGSTTDLWPPYLELRDVATNAQLGRWEMEDFADGAGVPRLPILLEWSPTGDAVAATLAYGDSADPNKNWDVLGEDGVTVEYTDGCMYTSSTCDSDIVVIPFDKATKTLQVDQMRTLVSRVGRATASDYDVYHFYPTWSPDGEYIAFVSAPFNKDTVLNSFSGSPQKSETHPYAVIRMVPSAGGPHVCPGDSCWELRRGAQAQVCTTGSDAPACSAGDPFRAGNATSTWPKFAPFAMGEGEDIFFLAMHSRIPYGFLEPWNPGTDGGGNPLPSVSQLWMFAVDVSNLQPGVDPSHEPIWLPQQQVTDGSLTAFWTEALACDANMAEDNCGCLSTEQCVVVEGACTCQVILR